MTQVHQTPGMKLPTVFIGSSSEGLNIGRYLQEGLEATGSCSVTRWDQGVFHASGYTMEGLTDAARKSDFAVLIATADDTVQTRGDSRPVARDNVIFELGLFIGALGRKRTFIVADRTRDLQLPSDLNGLTWLPYKEREDGNTRAALNGAILGIDERVSALGKKPTLSSESTRPPSPRDALDREIAQICSDARNQGWQVKTDSATTLRLQSREGRRFTFTIGEPAEARVTIREFAARLRANGLRVSQSVRRPVEDAPVPRR